jgi:hypothetical protein
MTRGGDLTTAFSGNSLEDVPAGTGSSICDPARTISKGNEKGQKGWADLWLTSKGRIDQAYTASEGA